MRIARANISVDKSWSIGPWNSNLDFSIGYANRGINEPHQHSKVTEVYLVARGSADVRVERETFTLTAGDILILEPGEAHTFLSSSPGYFHFVLHAPGLPIEEVRDEKIQVSRSRLGL